MSNSKYDNGILHELCENFDLLEYASLSRDFVKRSSDSYCCSCPFHKDVTPSLSITPKKNRFHCFSCGIGGSPIDWMTKVEGMSFDDAVSKIAEYSGRDINSLKICEPLAYFKKNRPVKREYFAKHEEREILSMDWYNETYSDDIPLEWKNEGMSEEMIRSYNIRMDYIANRIVYPIIDNDGNMIGVKGRTTFQDYKGMKVPKYMNYHKIGTHDFYVGLPQNWEYIKEENEVIIFEGIKSGIKLSSFSEHKRNWVSSETSSLTKEQELIIIKAGIKNVVMAYDSEVKTQHVLDCTKMLRRFCNVYMITNRHKLLEDKDSPVDKGEEVWNQLYAERRRI